MRHIKPITIIIHPAVGVDFFAGKAIGVGVGKTAALGDRVAEGVVTVTGCQRLVGGLQIGDVAVGVGVIEIVRQPLA